ncbi:hypothetical protein [Nocardia salmonicida]
MVDSPGTGAYTLVYNALGAEGEPSAPTAAFTPELTQGKANAVPHLVVR